MLLQLGVCVPYFVALNNEMLRFSFPFGVREREYMFTLQPVNHISKFHIIVVSD